VYQFQPSSTRCSYCGRAFEATSIGGVCFHCDEIVHGGLHFKAVGKVQEMTDKDTELVSDFLEAGFLGDLAGMLRLINTIRAEARAEALKLRLLPDQETDLRKNFDDLCNELVNAKAANAALSTKFHDNQAENKRLREALTPSEGTKAAYSGEFSFIIPDCDEDGNDVCRNITVPWTTIKEIMAAVLARAALDGSLSGSV
jgi:hypothetical protein